MTLLVTGVAGFIGHFLAKKLLSSSDDSIIGVDNLNDYYDVSIKEERLRSLLEFKKFKFERGDISEKAFIEQLFKKYKFDMVINLAAQAGVRYSISNPDIYIQSNIVGFFNILEACRNNPVSHLVYASSSSVYGDNARIPFSTEDKTDSPVSLYAATKKTDELLAYAYSKLYKIPTTGLRFFTVYGPMGRPDMAYFSFTNKLVKGEKIKIFNNGNCKRDFTYVDDVVEGILRIMKKPPLTRINEDGTLTPPFKIYNIGKGRPEDLMEFVHILCQELIVAGVLKKDFSIEAHMELVPMQKGDVAITYADTGDLERDTGFRPSVSLKAGLRSFSEWYYSFYMKGRC